MSSSVGFEKSYSSPANQMLPNTGESELDIFKKELRRFYADEKDHQGIAERLFEIIPRDLPLEEVVNFIFEVCDNEQALLINAILTKHPSFILSPYNQLRKAIVEDRQHLLTNDSLNRMFKERGIDMDETKSTSCYDLAYRIQHPSIYRPAKTPVQVSDYTLNFLWINLNPQDRVQDIAQNIFKEGTNSFENAECLKEPAELRKLEGTELSLEQDAAEKWKQIKETFTYKLSKWADAHPNAQINLWFDSALVTKKAYQKTIEMMSGISQSRKVHLTLRDIRKLPNIKGEIEHSLHPGTQVYYRVDVLKALIADDMISISEKSAKYCIVSDIDIEPLHAEQIFDQRTIDYLEVNGYVFNRKSCVGDFENSFFIFNKDNHTLKITHDRMMIQRMEYRIAQRRKDPINSFFGSEVLDANHFFKFYPDFLERMKDPVTESPLARPRKILKCPPSQFNGGGNFPLSDPKAESFRFIGDSNVPYTRWGRNFHLNGNEGQLDALKEWKAEPLDLPQ